MGIKEFYNLVAVVVANLRKFKPKMAFVVGGDDVGIEEFLLMNLERLWE